jgi:DNA polymerase-3 subunit delta
MVAYKTGSLQRIIKSLEPECRAALVYGPDAGLVAERAAALADEFAGKRKDAAEIVRLDERDLAEDPARLEVELRTVPMFAERKVVRVAAGAKLDVHMLKALLEAPLAGALVIEAGALRPDSAMRKLFESHKMAAALPSYSDERSASELIEEELDKADLKIDSETRSYLMTRLGADQALSRAEVAKLALFASGHGRVTPSLATAPRLRLRPSCTRSVAVRRRRRCASSQDLPQREPSRRSLSRRLADISRSSTASPRHRPLAAASSRRCEL